MTPPRDIPLPLPAPSWFLQILVVATFLLHIFFVNLMVGGVLLVFTYQLRGLRDEVYDRLAHAIAQTVTVNKSIAVVLGVGPLLVMGVLYTVHFYTANILTGTAWMTLPPLIAATFLLLYLHKYSWERLAAHRALHVALGGVNALLMLSIPLVFLANANLALFPDRWPDVHGFLSSLSLPNVWPRYLHFLGASLALTSLFCVYWFGRAAAPDAGLGGALDKAALRRAHYGVAFFVSALQLGIGPVVLLTLPSQGLSGPMLGMLALGVAFAIPALVLLWKEIDRPATHLGARFPVICTLLATTVLCMGSARHFYREAALAPHRAAMALRTAVHEDLAFQAYKDLRRSGEMLPWEHLAARGGEGTFRTYCAVCHAVDFKLVGPPLTEIAHLYAGKPEAIVAWAKAPGRKRPGFPQMPAFARVLSEPELAQVAGFMLKTGGATAK
jgi:cytochrome c